MFWRVFYGNLRLLRRHQKQALKFERIQGGWCYPKTSERCGGWWTLSQPKPCPEQADRCWITRNPVILLTGQASSCILPSINAPIRPGVIWAEETCDLRRKGRECHSTSSPLSNPLKSEWGIQYSAPCWVHFSFLAENVLCIHSTDAFIQWLTNRYRHDILVFLASCFIGAKVTSTLLLLIPISVSTFSYASCTCSASLLWVLL